MTRRAGLWSAALCVLLAVAVAVVVPRVVHDSGSDEAAAADVRTATVESGALAAGMTLSGVLSRGEPEPLTASTEGVVTWLPQPGDTVAPGDVLYEVNGRPVLLLPGGVPLWRTLELGDEGPDALALNTALHDLGLLDESRVDDVFGPGASAAVASLYTAAGYDAPSDSPEGVDRQEEATASLAAARSLSAASSGGSVGEAATEEAGTDDGADEDPAVEDDGDESSTGGADEDAAAALRTAQQDAAVAAAEWVDAADVVMLDVDELRVETVSLRVGDPAGGEVLHWTSRDVGVTAEITASQSAAVAVGDPVEITLASAEKVDGKIADVVVGGGAESESGETEARSRLVVTVDDQDAVASMVGTAVQVSVVADSVESSLKVPVTALVALAEGGYAVERVGSPGAETTLVAVDVLLVAEAQVAVSSADLKAGDEVVVP
jgi:hypothetical protein